MQTITTVTNVYSFNELSNEAKQKAISHFCDINVDYDWWNYTYEDAANIGLKITSFDIGRGSYCKGVFANNAYEVANLIIKNHGEICESYKTAQMFINEWNALVSEMSDGINKQKVCEDKTNEFDDLADYLENEFLKNICEDYRIILQKEYESLTSEKAVIETIEANDYQFTESGEMF